jgi:cytoskeletal protein RodZ
MTSPSGGQSRLFIIVVIGLVGLLMVGLLAIAGLVVYTRFLAPTPPPTVVAGATSTPRPTVAPTVTSAPTVAATSTPPEEGATATKVIQEGSPTAVVPTATPGGPTPTPTAEGGDEMAPTGFGPLEALLGGVGLLLVILLVRRLRLSSPSS